MGHLPHAVEPFTSIITLINVPLAPTVGVLFIPNIILLHIIQLLKCFYFIILTKAIIQLLIVFFSLSGIHAILLHFKPATVWLLILFKTSSFVFSRNSYMFKTTCKSVSKRWQNCHFGVNYPFKADHATGRRTRIKGQKTEQNELLVKQIQKMIRPRFFPPLPSAITGDDRESRFAESRQTAAFFSCTVGLDLTQASLVTWYRLSLYFTSLQRLH